MSCDRISLGRIVFRKIVAHGIDKAASHLGRKIERLTDYHVRSDVAAAAQICLPLRAQLIRLFPELSFEPT